MRKLYILRNAALSCLLLAATQFAIAQPNAALLKTVSQMAYADSARLVGIFKDIHTHPELGMTETRTAEIVAKALEGLGFKVYRGIGKTGVVGVLVNGNGPTVMYRADMDALPVKEVTGLPYASTATVTSADGKTVPVMHACGHDAHVTWLIGIARVMVALKSNWHGTLELLAQPAEELILGAQAMHDDTTYQKQIPVPDYLFGMHTSPAALGIVMNPPGIRSSGSDQLDVTFHGVGGHGSSPQLAKDPIVMACEAVLQYQTIISRFVNPQTPAVLTVGSLQSGDANNVIPASALVKINLRWFSKQTRDILFSGIYRIDSGIALSNGLPPNLYPTTVTKGYCVPMDNDTALVNTTNAWLAQVVAPGMLHYAPTLPGMPSEDFMHLVLGNNKTKRDYLQIGTAPLDKVAEAHKQGKDFPFFNHNGNYMVDLGAMPLGVTIGSTVLLSALGK